MILTNSSQVLVLFGVKFDPELSYLDVELAFIVSNISNETVSLSDDKGENHYLIILPNAIRNRPRDVIAENIKLKVLNVYSN